MFTAPLIIISIYDIQHLSSFEDYQGLLMSELYQGLLHLLCKVEQKRKQSVFSGSNDKLVFQLYFFSKTLHLHDLAHIFLNQYVFYYM